MKASKKLTALLLAFVLTLSLITPALAATYSNKSNPYNLSVSFHYYNMDGSDKWAGTTGYVGEIHNHYIDGVLGYCIDPGRETNNGDTNYAEKTWEDLESSKQYAVTRALAYGAPHNGDTSNASIAATQYMVWGMITGYLQQDGSINPNVGQQSPWATAINNSNHAELKTAYEALKNKLASTTGLPAGVTTDTVKVYRTTSTYSLNGSSRPYQAIAVLEYELSGNLTLVKASANTALTNGNSCYSLAGAVYGVYPTQADAQNKSNSVGTLTTLADGTSNAVTGLEAKTYYVRELTAPKGFALSPAITPVTVEAGKTATANVTDYPQSDPVGILLRKVDSKTGDAPASGVLSLEGAEFTVKYYDGQYSTAAAAEASGAPTRTWVFKTDPDGMAFLTTSYKVSGDDLYTRANGRVTLPLGTLVIQETKAPTGYQLNPEKFVRNITADGSAEDVNTYNAPIISEEPETGKAKLVKTSEDGKVAGIEFHVTGPNGYSKTIQTGADGTFELTDLYPGDYTAVETVPDRYKPQQPQTVTVEPGKTGTFTFVNQLARGGIKIRKSDADTKAAAQGDGTLAGAKYDIINNTGEDVLVLGKTYANGEVVYTLTTDAVGEAGTPVDLLPIGPYVVRESTAPTGYLVDVTEKTVTVPADDFVTLSDLTDEVIRGSVKIRKNDTDLSKAQGGATLAGARYDIINNSQAPVVVDGKTYATGETVMTLTTDAKGEAQAPAKSLPYGSYILRESAAPTGYLLRGVTEISFEIREDGQVVELTEELHDDVIRGGVRVRKYDADTWNEPQGDATLTGAEFQIVSLNDNPVVVNGATYSKGDVVYTMVTAGNENMAETPADLLPYGRYELVEAKAPEGYTTKGHISEQFSVTEDGQIYDLTLDNADRDQDTVISNEVIRGRVRIVKHSDTGETGVATPEVGAQFQVYLASATSYDAAKETERELLTIDEDGFAESKLLPYGTYVVEQISGFESSDFVEPFTVKIAEDGKTYSFILNNQTFTGFVKVTKTDARTGQVIPVAGVGFRLYDHLDQPVTWFDHEVYYTNDEGICRIPAQLPYNYGYYLMEEPGTAPDGYVLTTEPVYFDVIPSAAVKEFGLNVINVTFENEPTKVQISKQDMGGVEIPGNHLYVIDQETGEKVDEWISTDEPHMIYNLLIGREYALIEELAATGFVKASAIDFVIQDTAQVQQVVMVDKILSVAKVDYTGAYVPGAELAVYEGEELIERWNSADEPHAVSGLEVHHTYTLRELSAPEGWLLADPIEFTVTDDMKDQVITMEDEEIPEIHTTATVDEGHMAQAAGTVTLVDRVFYDKLIPGREYTLTGTLMVKETGKELLDKDGNPYVSVVTFTPDEPSGYVDVIFEIDADELGGQTVVAFEDLSKNGKTLVVHADIEDEEQSVHFPEIKTTATVDGEHIANAEGTVTLTDVVSYTNLIPGHEYTVKGVLMDQATGEAITDAEGKKITAEVAFTPETADGSVEVTFTFDASELADHSTVVFETLYEGARLLAVHADIQDEGQTVHFPEIRTTLTGEGGVHVAKADKKLTLVDTVSYTNLIPGKKYTITGVLMDQETGEAILDKRGKEITAKTSFTPETADGTVEVTFTFDASELGGKTVVAFEALHEKDRLLAVHADIEDEEQSVHIPKLRTTATVESSHVALAAETVTLVDVVTYENLIPGKEYTVVGTLMDQRTGKAFKTADGKPITAETTFTPEEPNGSVEVTFVFNGSLLAGHTTVVFEDLYHEGILIGTHADIRDEEQSVHFPEVKTTATVNGKHKAAPSEEVTLIDVVAYDNLIPGREYTVKGVLMIKETGKALLDKDGKPVTAEATFVAEKAKGKVELTFVFDASALAGKSVVAFEEIYDGQLLVGVHADMEDKGQTVGFIPKSPDTGDISNVGLWAAVAGLSGTALAAGIWLGVKRRKRPVEA